MNGRPFQFPSKNQEMCVTLSNGRTYCVCSSSQFKLILRQTRQKIVVETAQEGRPPLSPAELEYAVNKWIEEKSSYATMSWLLSKMTLNEQENFKNQYRFSGIYKCCQK